MRLSRAGAVILALLGGLGAAVTAQDEEAEEDNGGFTLKFVGTGTWTDGTMQSQEGFDEVTGNASTMIIEASDPRLSGTWTEVFNCREGGPPLFMVCVGSVRVENEGGTWLGTHEGYRREGIDNLAPTILEGQDGYAGLTAVLDYAQHHGASVGKGIAGDGYIVDFEMPDPPEPFAE